MTNPSAAFAADVVTISGKLYEAAAPLLAGRPPHVQGAALADLTAIWLAGHPPEMREELLAGHVAVVRDLIPYNEAIFTRGEQ